MTEPLSTVDNRTAKHDLLAAMVPQRALAEVEELRREGIDVDQGTTEDPAYENPRAIRDTFVRVHKYGGEYRREVGRLRQLMVRAAALASQAPLKPIRSWGKRRVAAHRALTERVRGRIMYDRPEVQGQPWHQQNGRATALVTIVDALDLATPGSDGLYDRMSGRLDSSLLTVRFGKRTGWLEGLTLEDAITEAAMRFRGRASDEAVEFAAHELAEVQDFVTTAPQPGFKDIVGYCVDSLGEPQRRGASGDPSLRRTDRT